MFESMMMRFQEDTARHLFRMQILAPDGTPIETQEQLNALQTAPPQQLPPQIQQQQQPRTLEGNAQQPTQQGPPPPVIPTRPPSTTIDALEREFEKKKQRELEVARMAGGSSSNGVTAPRNAGAKLGRNDECFCGSGKKYKKCHGVNA